MTFDAVTLSAIFTGITGVLGGWAAIRAARVRHLTSENERLVDDAEARDAHDVEVARWRIRFAEWLTDFRVRAAEKGVTSDDPPPFPKRPAPRTRNRRGRDAAELEGGAADEA